MTCLLHNLIFIGRSIHAYNLLNQSFIVDFYFKKIISSPIFLSIYKNSTINKYCQLNAFYIKAYKLQKSSTNGNTSEIKVQALVFCIIHSGNYYPGSQRGSWSKLLRNFRRKIMGYEMSYLVGTVLNIARDSSVPRLKTCL